MLKRSFFLAAAAGVLGLAGSAPTPRQLPRYAADGALIRPEHVEAWILLGASLGLGYSDDPGTSGPGTFHNVYLEPHAYRTYVETGRFPDKTMLAMLLFQPGRENAAQPAWTLRRRAGRIGGSREGWGEIRRGLGLLRLWVGWPREYCSGVPAGELRPLSCRQCC